MPSDTRGVICRDCGARGEEDRLDLMPNTCPACFERRIALVFALVPPDLDTLIERLVGVGCERDLIALFIHELAATRRPPAPRRPDGRP